MGMDKNSILGFALLGLLFIGYFYYNSLSQKQIALQNQHIEDSINRLKPKVDTALLKIQAQDSLVKKDAVIVGVEQDSSKKEELIEVENKVVKITFTNKGGQPQKVELKNFKTFKGQPVLLDDGTFNNISYAINTGNNQTAQTSDLLFTPSAVQKTEDGSQIISFFIQTTSGQKIEHQFIIKADDYMVDFNIKLNGTNNLFTQNTMNLLWKAKADQMEKTIDWETQQSHISFVENGEYDFEHIMQGKEDSKKFSKPVDWVSINQQFFVNTIIAKNKFTKGELQWVSPKDTSKHIIGEATANMQISIPAGNDALIPMQLYYGPSDYKILKSYGNQMFNIVPLGSGIFAFVKYVNRGFVLPVFNFLSSKIVSLGLVIALMTILIRLLISPLSYQSYLSGAKMKLLKPEIEELKKKHGDDKQAFGMDQMKLFKSAGVNPLGGCIPALLQIPIFFALYNFFNSNISLRGVSFWWATDLSTYDSIYTLPFTIPFYGDHVSLFTILATVTSLLISLYGMSNMQDTGNPMMKYLPFIFPVVLLGVFNRMPAALTWYYTVSNAITLLIQFVIQKYIIDHDKIMAKLQENKKKPVSKSKWQEKVEAMQQSNDKLKQMRQKVDSGKKKK
jgi:YidC/Oxa1 family membrane protein insertase